MNKSVDFTQSIQDAFLRYGASVAQERSIADVRDGLKIGLRQGLYAQYTNKLTSDKPYKKALKSVAAATSQSYTHGDQAIYDTFVRTAKPWAVRYLLEDAQGSIGSPCAPDDHTASRYLEMRASKLSNYFFQGLKKNAVGNEWYWNYDDSEKIPSVFPSIGYWNIVNGCTGIAVAMSTSVPSLNIREVNAALVKLIKNPEIDFNEIYCAPDFPTGGTIMNAEEVKESMRKGRGSSIRIRANLEYQAKDNKIIASQLPYGVYTNTICKQLAELTEDEDYGIEKIVDHTKKKADIHIYLSKNANPTVMIQKLYKDTSLESWFAINMIMLDQGRFPKVFGWKEACQAYINHIRECQRRITQYDYDTLVARNHILEGLLIAIAHIDEVVALIRHSKDGAEAKTKLMKSYNFDEAQAKAILDLKLQRLANLEAIKVNNEYEQNNVELSRLNNILTNPTELDQILIAALEEVAKEFGDARRTKITNIIGEEEEEEEAVPVIVKIQGGKIGIVEKNVGKNLLQTTSTETLIGFAADGKMNKIKVNELTSKMVSLDSIFKLKNVLNVATLTTLKTNGIITYITKNGYIKKTRMKEYTFPPKASATSMKLQEGDKLIAVDFEEKERVEIIDLSGKTTICYLNKIDSTGKAAKGKKLLKDTEIKTLKW